MRHSYDFILAYVRLVKILKQERIDILQTWMYHADFMGALAKLLYGRFKLIWTICHGDVSMSPLKRKTYFIAKICGHFSDRWPDKIICCSEATKKSHMKFGYAANKMCVVPNGFDVSLFKIDKAAGEKIRAELGLSDDHFIIGHAGRFHPVKDHFTFIQTAALVARQYKNVRFICCGTNIDWDNVELKAWIDKEGIRGFFVCWASVLICQRYSTHVIFLFLRLLLKGFLM